MFAPWKALDGRRQDDEAQEGEDFVGHMQALAVLPIFGVAHQSGPLRVGPLDPGGRVTLGRDAVFSRGVQDPA